MQLLFSVFLILVTSLLSTGCGHPLLAADLYHGQVVDEETGQPLVGAIITVIWSKAPLVHLASPRYFQSAQETVTDSQGKFELLVSPGIDWNPFTFVSKEPDIVIYQAGYEPVHACVAGANGVQKPCGICCCAQKGMVVKLSKLKTEKENRKFLDGSGLGLGFHQVAQSQNCSGFNAQRKLLGMPPLKD